MSKCLTCKADITSNKKFCNPQCYGKWRSKFFVGENSPKYQRVERICTTCGKRFSISPLALKSGQGKHCSRICADRGKYKVMSGPKNVNYKGRPRKTCLICGKFFYPKLVQLRKGYGKYCSRKCFAKWYSINRSGTNNPQYKGINKKCLNCQKDIVSFPCLETRGIGKFCSAKCFGIYNVAHNWKCKDTKIERTMEKLLLREKIEFKKQYPISNISVADFLIIPQKIAIYCDGTYWHSLPRAVKKDADIEIKLPTLGFTVCRLPESLIEKQPEECIAKIKDMIKDLAVVKNLEEAEYFLK